MSTALSEQLAAELGCAPEEAEHALRDLLDEVKARTQAGETVSLPGLGTFSMEEGTLHFEPAQALQKAVNYRNAHLEPLPVSDEPEQEAPDDEDAVPDVEPPTEAASPDTEPPAEVDAEVDETAATPAEPEDVPDLSEDWTEELDEEDAEPAPPHEPSSAPDEADEPSTGQIAGLVASIALLLGLVWFVLGTQGVIPGPGALFQGEPAPAATGADTVATAAPVDTAAAEPETDADTAATQPAASPSTPPTIDRATGGWTIVVASRTRPGQAEAVLSTYRQRFRGEGLAVDILTGESGGQLRYRIAIGQYDSRAAAQSALQQLEGRVPSDAWPLEIQPGS